ncbi:MAG: hypothetical protein ACYTBP_12640 [Planctomycetota bacterium]|jgi:hypothetical protein
MKKNKSLNIILAGQILFCLFVFGTQSYSQAPGGDEEKKADYLKIVKSYADAMISRGRDTYGQEHSPLFAVMLDRKTMRLFSEEQQKRLWQIRLDDWENWGIRNRDRIFKGADPHDDTNLYQILYALAKITGDQSYAHEADKTIKWFFEHCQSPATGLMAWGEHMGWDFNTETIIRKKSTHHGGQLLESETHEFGGPWIYWGKSFELAPQACEKFALGLWNHQIYDQQTGNFSRHAIYTKHHTEKDSEYPRHGGFYIAAWAEAYRRTQKPVFTKAIETLTTYFDNRRNPATGALPAESAKRSRGKVGWPSSSLSLAIDLSDGAEKVPPALAEKMRSCASKTDNVFLKLEHDIKLNGKGFLGNIYVDTLRPTSHVAYTGLLNGSDAGTANLCMLRYRQTKLQPYRKLIMRTAKLYLKGEPDFPNAVRPGQQGNLIYLMLNAYEITGKQKFLQHADYFAQQGITRFLDDGLPLPKANTKYDHYEAVTGGDMFMMGLLRLWIVQDRPDMKYQLSYSSR